jgi:hypothetical protein
MMTIARPKVDIAAAGAQGGCSALRRTAMTGSIDTAYADLMNALPPDWLLVSISIDGTRRYHALAMSQTRIDPAEPWQVSGIGRSIAEALSDATRRLLALAG